MNPRISDMHPDLMRSYLAFCGRMAEKSIPFGLSCVLRTKAEQAAFYAQGREPLSSVNSKRIFAGMTLITDAENVIVTHTLNSRHFPDENGKSRAFDIFIITKGKRATWDIKYDGNDDNAPDYFEAADIGRSLGLDCGALWVGWKDYPHMQLPDKIA